MGRNALGHMPLGELNDLAREAGQPTESRRQRMIENNPSNVSSAFEILPEEIEAEIEFVNNIGARGFEKREYDRAKEALERAGVLTAFRDRVAGLRKE
jgi:hypothetical protein